MGLSGGKLLRQVELLQENPKARHHKPESHQRDAGANPAEKRSLFCQIVPQVSRWLCFDGRIHFNFTGSSDRAAFWCAILERWRPMRTCPLNSSLLFLNWLRLIWMALDVGGGDSDRPPPIKSRCLIRVNRYRNGLSARRPLNPQQRRYSGHSRQP